MFPLKPQLRSVTPIMLMSMTMPNGFASYGFQIETVESWLAIATML